MHDRDGPGGDTTTSTTAVVEQVRVERADVQRREVGQPHSTNLRDHVPAEHLGVALRGRRLDRVLHAGEPLLEVRSDGESARIGDLAGVNGIERRRSASSASRLVAKPPFHR